jgi:hypothetical protein
MTERKRNNVKTQRKGGRRRGARGKGGALTVSSSNDNMLSQIVEPWMPLFPARTTRRLRYASGHVGLSSTSGVVVTQVFALNGCFDPDITGTGHQPMGFDQMMGFYNHFCVLSCKATVRFGTASGNYGTACLRVDAGSTPVTDIERIMEFGGNVTTGLEALGAFGANKTLSIFADIAKLQGISAKALTADATLRGDSATNPTELTYLHVQLWNAAGVTVTCNTYTILEFNVMFLEPRTAALS